MSEAAARATPLRAPVRPEARLASLQIALYALPSLVSSVAAPPLALFVPAFYADDLGVPVLAFLPFLFLLACPR